MIPKDSRDDNLNRTPENLSSYQLVEVGDVVINKMKAWQGSIAVSQFRGIVSPDYLVASPLTEADPNYLHIALRAPQMIPLYAQRSQGIRPSQWRLYWEQFRQMTVPLPDLEEQRRIVEHLDETTARIDAMMDKVGALKSLLTERRSALITAAVTGQIEV